MKGLPFKAPSTITAEQTAMTIHKTISSVLTVNFKGSEGILASRYLLSHYPATTWKGLSFTKQLKTGAIDYLLHSTCEIYLWLDTKLHNHQICWSALRSSGTLYISHCHGNHKSDLRSDRQQPVIPERPREPWQWTLGWNASLWFLWNLYLPGRLCWYFRAWSQNLDAIMNLPLRFLVHSVQFTVGFTTTLDLKTKLALYVW